MPSLLQNNSIYSKNSSQFLGTVKIKNFKSLLLIEDRANKYLEKEK
jgi:hypothetical protein